MQITVESIQASTSISVLALEGELDGSNYQEVIAKSQELYHAGTRNIVLDLEKLRFMSSAGLVALHSVALILGGEKPPDAEAGWNVFHTIGRERDANLGKQQHLKLLKPQPKILSNLQKTGMDLVFDIFDDRVAALASFD